MKYPIYHNNITQRSEEWYKIRDLHLTASDATAIITNGKGLESLCRNKALQHILPSNRDTYISPDMERGIMLEPEARKYYEKMTGKKVKEVGFVEMSEYSGASPDGLIPEEEKGVEIKCPNDKNYFDYLLDGDYPKAYYDQCQMNMFVTGYKTWDLAFYNPNFKKTMIIHTIEADEGCFEKIREGLERGEELIKLTLKKYE